MYFGGTIDFCKDLNATSGLRVRDAILLSNFENDRIHPEDFEKVCDQWSAFPSFMGSNNFPIV